MVDAIVEQRMPSHKDKNKIAPGMGFWMVPRGLSRTRTVRKPRLLRYVVLHLRALYYICVILYVVFSRQNGMNGVEFSGGEIHKLWKWL
jgi:hypothetical protein